MAVVASTGRKLPAFFSFAKKSMPGWKSSSVPPVCTVREADGGERRAGLGRVAVERDRALVVGAEQVVERRRAS